MSDYGDQVAQCIYFKSHDFYSLQFPCYHELISGVVSSLLAHLVASLADTMEGAVILISIDCRLCVFLSCNRYSETVKKLER